VIAVGRRPQPLESLRASHPDAVVAVSADVGTEAGRLAIAETVSGAALNLLVHNAAVLEPAGPLAEMSLEAWREHQAINLEGPLFLTQALLPRLESGSRILHISSGAAHTAIQGWAAYCMSKTALHMGYQCWRNELQARSVLVGSVRPGVVDTPMQEAIRDFDETAFPLVEKFRAFKADGELEPPERVACFLGWLLLKAPEATFTAQELDIRDETLWSNWEDFQP
jgi:NAD(P)-dependent dehydrogenase (short-subunit alcohol dehydrogenase family)